MGKIGLGKITQNLCNFVNKALVKRTVGTLGDNLYHQTGSSGWLEAPTADIKIYNSKVEMLALTLWLEQVVGTKVVQIEVEPWASVVAF